MTPQNHGPPIPFVTIWILSNCSGTEYGGTIVQKWRCWLDCDEAKTLSTDIAMLQEVHFVVNVVK